MSDIAFTAEDLVALRRWFDSEPHLRPPSSGDTRELRYLFAKIEFGFHFGKLSTEQRALISSFEIPVGTGDLLSIADEHELRRNAASLALVREGECQLPPLYSSRYPDHIRKWVLAMRRLRERSPQALMVRILDRLFPDFPWSDGFAVTCMRAIASVGRPLSPLFARIPHLAQRNSRGSHHPRYLG